MIDTIYSPAEVYPLFRRRFIDAAEKSSEAIPLAMNPDYGIEISIAASGRFPKFIITMDGEELYTEVCVNEDDCRRTAEKLYQTYLTDEILSAFDWGWEEDDESRFEIECIIEDREQALTDAVTDFIEAAGDKNLWHLIKDEEKEAEVIEDVKEHFLEYLSRKWDIRVFRPMILEDEDGEEFYEEYPYEVLEFEDEDNPLYA